MLFVQSRRWDVAVEGAARLALLERLQEKGLAPLIRSARLHAYELALTGPDRAKELERLVAARAEEEADAPYVRGDVFCFEDFVLFLVFQDAGGEGGAGTRAGIAYRGDTSEPNRKLEAFCRNVEDALASSSERDAAGGGEGGNGAGFDPSNANRRGAAGVWRAGDARGADVFARFASDEGESGAPPQAQGGGKALTGAERARIVSLLEEAEARHLLRRLIEAQAEGRPTGDLLTKTAGGEGSANEALLGGLAGGGLVRREVAVSCRKQGRALFRLPSMEAFEMVTASGAVCSECGTSLADERAEELITPTALASVLLKDASWMASRLRRLLREEHTLPESEFGARAGEEEGESLALANVCGETFLFYLRDGDVSAADARRALELETETGAAHLVVVTSGKVQDEARARLREHGRRRARSGGGAEVLTIEGVEALAAELRQAFERVSQRVLAGELYELDEGLGLSVGHLVAARFRLMQRSGALRDLAASAAATLSGSLREM